tara:strand:- start:7922 stop:8257 length:336 start_codon:yes stop_codon:yes gene_type:complete
MANTYNWTINKLDVRPTQDSLSDVVYNIHWTYTATSDQTDPDGNAYTAEAIGTSVVGEPDPEDFTSFDDLTKSQVEEWLNADGSLANIGDHVDSMIEEQITPTSEAKDVPW